MRDGARRNLAPNQSNDRLSGPRNEVRSTGAHTRAALAPARLSRGDEIRVDSVLHDDHATSTRRQVLHDDHAAAARRELLTMPNRRNRRGMRGGAYGNHGNDAENRGKQQKGSDA